MLYCTAVLRHHRVLMCGIFLGAALLVPLGVGALVPDRHHALGRSCRPGGAHRGHRTDHRAEVRRTDAPRPHRPHLGPGDDRRQGTLPPGARHRRDRLGHHRAAPRSCSASQSTAESDSARHRLHRHGDRAHRPRQHTWRSASCYSGPRDLPVLADVFGGAQGVLGIEGLADKRIYADFTDDRLTITRSHGEHARVATSATVPLRSACTGCWSRTCGGQRTREGHHRHRRAGHRRQPHAARMH